MRVRSMAWKPFDCHRGVDLAATGVLTFEMDFIAGLNRESRGEGAIPERMGGGGA